MDALTSQTKFIGWVGAFLRIAHRWSRQNVVQDVALVDAGAEPGNAPVLGPDGRLPDSLVPEIDARRVTSGAFGVDQVPGLPASRFTGLVSSDRIRLDVSKLTGEVPLARIPASKRPSMRVGVTAVEAEVDYRIVNDAGQAAIWGRRPNPSKLAYKQEGSVAIITLSLTRYVDLTATQFRRLTFGLGIAPGQTTGTVPINVRVGVQTYRVNADTKVESANGVLNTIAICVGRGIPDNVSDETRSAIHSEVQRVVSVAVDRAARGVVSSGGGRDEPTVVFDGGGYFRDGDATGGMRA